MTQRPWPGPGRSPAGRPSPWSPTRRELLLGTALGGTSILLAGCGLRLDSLPAPAPVPGTDELARRSAAADARTLYLAVLRMSATAPAEAARAALGDIARVHRDHARALGVELGGPTPDPTQDPAPSPTAGAGTGVRRVGPVPVDGPDALAAAEGAAATRALTARRARVPAPTAPAAASTASPGPVAAGLADVSAELARLLASIGAGLAVNARAAARAAGQALPAAPAVPVPAAGPDTPAGAAGEAAAALSATLSGELAAVYAYEVAQARLAGPDLDRARVLGEAHRARAQLLRTRLGPTAAPDAPGYALPFPVRDPAGAARLAARVETGLAALYLRLVPAGSGAARAEAAGWLVECAVRRDDWAPGTWALPGA